MITKINLLKKNNFLSTYFMPDGQPHVKLDTYLAYNIRVISCRLASMNDIGIVGTLLNALNNINGLNKSLQLNISYLLGTRQDRYFDGEARTLEVICDIINNWSAKYGIKRVNVLHPHSNAPSLLINNFRELDHVKYVDQAVADFKPDFLVIPDLGAAKNSEKYLKYDLPMVQCAKKRDPKTGKLSGFEVLKWSDNFDYTDESKKGLIIDDIADGMGTFFGQAEAIRNELNCNFPLALYTTHGIYSSRQKAKESQKVFSNIYTTNSYHQTIPIEILDVMQNLKVFKI